MQTKTIIVSLLLATASVFNPTSPAATMNTVVLSRGYSAQQAASVRDRLVFHLLTSAPQESTWWLVEGDTPTTICGPFVIPTFKVDKPEARKRLLGATLAEILAWFDHQAPANQTNAGLIRLPQTLDFIASRRTPGPMDVYVIANPLFLATDDDSAFSFVGGRYPSLGHLLASRQASPFSLQGRRDQLQGVVVHFNYLDKSVFAGNQHRVVIETWWQAFIEGQGGKLGLFDASLKDFFGTKSVPPREKVPINQQDLTVAMLLAPPPSLSMPVPASPPTNSVPADVAAALKNWNDEFDRLAREKNFARLAERLEQARRACRARYHPTNWCPRLVDALIAWADTLPDRGVRRAKLQAALALAGDCPCATTVPSLKLSLLDLEEKAEKDVTLAEQRRVLTEFTSLFQAAEAIPNGSNASSLQNKLALYEKAALVAKTHGLSGAEVGARIQEVQRQLDRLLVPCALPSGCQAEVTRVSLEQPPYVLMDLSVTSASGEPVRGLQGKDFRILCDECPAKAVQVACVQNQPPLFDLVLCLDESSSMTGKPANAAKAAAKTMLMDLAQNDRFSVLVLAFSDKVRVLCDWTADKSLAASTIDGIRPRGKTALLDAVKTAAEALKEREGERRLVLFTDGCDTASLHGLKSAELAKQLRTAGIETYAIGLHNADLDANTLRRLADQYLEAANPEQLRAVFADARARLAREVYRFVITPDQPNDAAPKSFRVKVGGVNAVVVEGSARVP